MSLVYNLWVGKAKSLPKSGASERCFNQLGSSLTRNHYTRLERLARDQHSNLYYKHL
jgi:hypothetical protein